MTTSEQRQFPARLDVLPDMAAFAQAFCDRHGIVHDNALRLMFIIEELFTNTVEHGYRGECDAPVRIALSLLSDGVGLFYEDAAPRYDPLARLSGLPEGIARPVEARPVGGLGVFLVGQLVERSSYVYENGHNRLRLTLLLPT
jgi:serine/threonine-protein kinase RsbW/sigma-B regulation protein RsbU (phosphoserine phosphatase)